MRGPKALNVLDQVAQTARPEGKARLGVVREAATLEADLSHLRSCRPTGSTCRPPIAWRGPWRCRTTVIPRFWTEHSALRLVVSTLAMRASAYGSRACR